MNEQDIHRIAHEFHGHSVTRGTLIAASDLIKQLRVKVSELENENGRLRTIIPGTVERLNDELCEENERFDAENKQLRAENERLRAALICEKSFGNCVAVHEPARPHCTVENCSVIKKYATGSNGFRLKFTGIRKLEPPTSEDLENINAK